MSADLRSAVIDIGMSLNLRPAEASLVVSKAAEPGCRPGRSQRKSRAKVERGSRAYTDFAPIRQRFLVEGRYVSPRACRAPGAPADQARLAKFPPLYAGAT